MSLFPGEACTDETIQMPVMGGHGAGVLPFMNLGVPVGEADATGAIMVAGRHIDDHDSGRVHAIVHGNGEVAIIDAVGVFINEHMGVRRAHRVDVHELAEDAILCAGDIAEPIIAGVHGLAHGNAAHPGIVLAANRDGAFIRRAFIDAGGLGGVRCQLGVLRIGEPDGVGVIGVVPVVIEHAPHPTGAGLGQIIPDQVVTILVRIHDPGQSQLFVVAHTLNPLSLNLGLCQCWQQQRGEDGDNRDDHEEFDERECWTLGEPRGRSKTSNQM